MSRFDNYLTEGNSAGEDMEEGIVKVWNYLHKQYPHTEANKEMWGNVGKHMRMPKGLDPRVTMDACEAICDDLYQTYKIPFSWPAKRLGSDQIPVTKQWSSYFGGRTSSVPKTDFILGEHKISLKTGDSAMLMSGSRNETIATFYTAIEASGLKKSLYTDIIEKVETFRGGSFFDPDKLGVGETLKRGLADDMLLAAENIKNTIGKTISNSIQTNQKFARAFAFEAMTGTAKFGGNEGTASHFLTVSWDGYEVKYKECSDTSYIDYIAKQMKPNVSFKSTYAKKYQKTQYSTTLRLQITKLLAVKEEYERYDNRLDEGLLNAFWNKVKSILTDFYQSIVNILKQGLDVFLEFMGLEPEITVNIEVST